MQTIQLPIHLLEIPLKAAPGHTLSMILTEKNVIRVDVPDYMLAGKFANEYQKSVLNKGQYTALFQHMIPAQHEWRVLSLLLSGDRKKQKFSRLRLDFDYLFQEHPAGYWCLVPVLGVETFVDRQRVEGLDAEQLQAAVEEAVREICLIQLSREESFKHLQHLAALIWYERPQWRTHDLHFNIYTASELEAMNEEKQKTLLPNLAKALEVTGPVLFGMQTAFQQFADLLRSKYQRSVLLVGRSGLGKTTLVYEMARLGPSLGIPQKIWETTAATMIKELTGDIGWQENLTQLCKELTKSGEILFVRNFLELFEVGQYVGNEVSMGSFLRDFIARGELTLISECTEEELSLIELRHPNYAQQFNILRLEEPKEELQAIILNKVKSLAKQFKVAVQDEAIEETLRLHQRYLPYAGFPGKSIRFLESVLLAQNLKKGGSTTVNRHHILSAFCEETGMPKFMIDPEVPMEMEQVRQFFLQNVFGQAPAVQAVVSILAAVKTAMLRGGKPIASLLFVGPTGVGKTELAKVLAQFMFGNRDKMIRFDMSEFATPYAVSRLTGESFAADGLLTAAVRRDPFCVLLFDELEKAHPLFNDLLLQMLGEGRLTDSRGRIVNFCSTIIIMTSNIGASRLQMNPLGWGKQQTVQTLVSHFENEVRQFFRPEIFNRIDQIIPFYALDPSIMEQVVQREIKQLLQREGIFGRSLDLKIAPEVYELLCQKGYDPKYGARALQRSIRELLVAPLAQQLNTYNPEDPVQTQISVKDNQTISIQTKSDPLKIEWMLERLTHDEYMDYASDLRYEIANLIEGHAVLRLKQQLEELERDKRQDKKGFWGNFTAQSLSIQSKGQQYSLLLALLHRLKQEQQQIEQIEEQMALMALAIEPLRTDVYKKASEWEKIFFGLKVEMVNTLHPEYNHCRIGIYGKDWKALAQFYRQLAFKQGFEVQAQSVWHCPRLTKENAQPNEAQDADEESNEDQNEAASHLASPYEHQPYDFEQPQLKATQADDTCVGLELIINGPAAYFYFATEDGYQEWKSRDGKNKQYLLVKIAEEEQFTTPEGLSRKQNQKIKPRRVLVEGLITEDILHEVKGPSITNNADWLHPRLEKQFKQKINALLS
jgi:ATP-dependent Clp protease ATP-binding subunit ClpA